MAAYFIVTVRLMCFASWFILSFYRIGRAVGLFMPATLHPCAAMGSPRDDSVPSMRSFQLRHGATVRWRGQRGQRCCDCDGHFLLRTGGPAALLARAHLFISLPVSKEQDWETCPGVAGKQGASAQTGRRRNESLQLPWGRRGEGRVQVRA